MELFDQKESRRIHTVYFDNKDIERHPAVKEVLEIYGDCQ